jgi:hypothetical protein
MVPIILSTLPPGVALAVASLVAARAIAERACAHGVLMTAALAQSP